MASRSLWRSLPEQRLFWFAGGAGTPKEAAAAAARAGATIGPVLCLEELQSAAYLKLEIPFFSKAQLGAAHLHGPLDLNTIFAFCAELRETLSERGKAEEKPGAVCLCCSRRVGAVANSLLLLGAFLVLEKRLPAVDVLDLIFGAPWGNPGGTFTPIEQRFPTPFCAQAQFSQDSLSVQDCLFGLEEAVQRGWLDPKLLDTNSRKATTLSVDATQVFEIGVLPKGEQSELKRVQFWVAADPVTTVIDPTLRADPTAEPDIDDTILNGNPSDPSIVSSVKTGKSIGEIVSNQSPASATETGIRFVKSPSQTTQTLAVTGKANVLRHTPTAEWDARSPHASLAGGIMRSTSRRFIQSKLPTKTTPNAPMERPADLPAFARWLKKSLRCNLLVRTNFPDERGLPAGGSYSDLFSRWGVPQIDLPFTDGTAPPPRVASAAVKHVELLLKTACTENASRDRDEVAATSQAVVVHCKSGLGRSMSVLGALAVSLSPGLSGGAYFGWARLVRPGAIQTSEQERFLRSLDEEGDCSTSCCLWRCFGSQARAKDVKKEKVADDALCL